MSNWEERNIAREYSTLIVEDLKADQQSYEYAGNYFSQVQQFGNKALTLWSDSQEIPPDKLVIYFYQASNIIANNPNSGAYDSLESTGRLGLIAGPELAPTLSNYYTRAIDPIIFQSTPYRMEIRGILPPHVQILIRKNCTELTLEGSLNEILSDNCDIGLNTNEALKILSSIKQHPKIAFYLRQKIVQDALATEVLKLKYAESQRLLDIFKQL